MPLRQANRVLLIAYWKVRPIQDPQVFNWVLTCTCHADVESPSEHKPIARLAHGLDRVLFKCDFPHRFINVRLTVSCSPGVYWLQDPRSRVYNFTPWLETIPKVTDFAFERVTGFIRSSQDNVRSLPLLSK